MSSTQIGALPTTIAILKTRTRARSSGAADRARIRMIGSAGRMSARVMAKYRCASPYEVENVRTTPDAGWVTATHRLTANNTVLMTPAMFVKAMAVRSITVKRDVSG